MKFMKSALITKFCLKPKYNLFISAIVIPQNNIKLIFNK